jgi:hypothetical protein
MDSHEDLLEGLVCALAAVNGVAIRGSTRRRWREAGGMLGFSLLTRILSARPLA